MLYNFNAFVAIPCLTRGWRRVQKLLYSPSTMAALPAAGGAANFWPGEVVSHSDKEHRHDRGSLTDVRMAP